MKLRSLVAATAFSALTLSATVASSANLKVLSSWNKNIWPTYIVLDTFSVLPTCEVIEITSACSAVTDALAYYQSSEPALTVRRLAYPCQ